MNFEQQDKLNKDILNDDARVASIYEFLEETNTWHNLCRKSLLNMNVHKDEIIFNKLFEYYPYEKLTFTFLLYYDFSGKSLIKINNIFIKSFDLYEEMLNKHNLDKFEMIEEFKFKICVASIFGTIAKNKDTFDKVKEQYKNFCIVQELNKSLPKNSSDKKKIKM
jgi:hypothetical protein